MMLPSFLAFYATGGYLPGAILEKAFGRLRSCSLSLCVAYVCARAYMYADACVREKYSCLLPRGVTIHAM